MSWVLSAIAVCVTLAVFTAGTMGVKTFEFGFQKASHRVSILNRVVNGRHRNEDAAGAHGVTRKDESTCTEDEVERRIEALRCKEEYMRAVRKELGRNNCTNVHFISSDIDHEKYPCAIIDEKDDVNCSEECSYRQHSYFICKFLGEETFNIFRECGESDTLHGADFCSFNNRDFCLSIDPLVFQTVFNECFLENDISCSDGCKEAVEELRDTHGCCVKILQYEFSNKDMMQISDAFSACGVEIPEVCTSLSPPEKFLDCARDGDVQVSPIIFYSTVLIVLSMFNAM